MNQAARKIVISVELFGLARVISDRREITLELEPGASDGSVSGKEIVSALAIQEPRLVGSIIRPDGVWLNEGQVANVNGRRYLTEPDERLFDGDRLLLLANAAGG